MKFYLKPFIILLFICAASTSVYSGYDSQCLDNCFSTGHDCDYCNYECYSEGHYHRTVHYYGDTICPLLPGSHEPLYEYNSY